VKIYYSRWIGSYSTERDNRILGYIIDRFNLSRDDVLDPSSYRHGEHKMEYYLSKVDDADILIYYELAPGIISAGVAKEIRHALRKGKKVYKVTLDEEPRLMEVKEIREEALTVNETRYINEVALQYKIPIEKITRKYLEVRKRYRELTNKEALILATAELIEEESEGLITVKYILKRKLPKQYKIDTRKLMAKIGLIKLDKRGRRIYTEEERIKAVKLAEKHGNIKIAAKILGIPESTLRKWIRNKDKILKKWDIKPTKELAYVIGAILSDGSVYRTKDYHYRIELYVKDLEYALEFWKAISKVLNKRYKKPFKTKDGRWRAEYSSKKLYTFLKSKKLDKLKPYIEYNKNTVRYFLRALYDGDGSNYMNYKITLRITNKKLIDYVKELLYRYFNIESRIRIGGVEGEALTIESRSVVRKRKLWELVITKHAKMFLKEIGFTITEKRLGLPRRKKSR